MFEIQIILVTRYNNYSSVNTTANPRYGLYVLFFSRYETAHVCVIFQSL